MRALYTAATGMAAQQLRIDNIANNLSNVSTTGFKKSQENFEDLMYQQIATGTADPERARPAPLQVGTGVRMVNNAKDFTPGAAQTTGRALDVAIQGRGFFVVEDANGNEHYTRDGSFSQNADGELVTSGGMPLTDGIVVPSDAESLVIDEDGTVKVTYADQPGEEVTLGAIQLVDFVNAAGLRAEGGNLYSATPESGEPQIMDPSDGQVRLAQAALEGSNVDVAEELINMVMAQRAFELTSKVIAAADQNLQTVANLKR